MMVGMPVQEDRDLVLLDSVCRHPRKRGALLPLDDFVALGLMKLPFGMPGGMG